MSEVLLTGLGVIALITTWKYIWLPTLLDTTRDKLFDLRDNVLREHFVQREAPLSGPIYTNLRKLLNGHLRHTESLVIWEYAFFVNAMKKESGDINKRFSSINRQFKTDDPELQKLAKEIREKSSAGMLIYMAESSVFMMALVLVVLPVYVLRDLSLRTIFTTKPAKRARAWMEKCALSA